MTKDKDNEFKTLKELITAFRECKTQAEERALILREKAIIRNSFLPKDFYFRARNLAKLIWINMLGYDTDFGQMACLNTLANEDFALKKIAYICLGIFFDDKSEALLLATHRIGLDLADSNHYVVALALSAFSEIADPGMCESLHENIFPKVSYGQKYIRKKAMMASMRILNKKPELVGKMEEYCESLISEKSHGLLMCGLSLANKIIQLNPEFKHYFEDGSRKLMRLLKDISSQYSSEYDVDGVNDPFLQVKIVKFLGNVATEGSLKEDFSSLLATLTVNLPTRTNVGSGNNISSNAVNCILYECVKIIMQMDAAKTLKKVGIGILSGFLQYKDVNSKYISLKTLLAASKLHKKFVQKHLTSILGCLKEDDLSLRRMTLDILKHISEDSNIKTITTNIINDMLVCKKEFLEDMTPSVCYIIEKRATSKIWYFTSMLRILVIAGNYVNEESINSLLNVISNTQEIQAYALYKLYIALCENQDQEGLAKTIFWLLGEHADILVSGFDPHTEMSFPKISEENILNLITNILNSKIAPLTRQLGINCVAKLYNKFEQINSKKRIKKVIEDHKRSENYEAQIRAVEYSVLLDENWSEMRSIVLKEMPAPDPKLVEVSEKEIGNVNIGEIQNSKPINVKLIPKSERRKKKKQEKKKNLSVSETEDTDASTQNVNDDEEEAEFDLLNEGEPEQVQPKKPAEENLNDDLMQLDLQGGGNEETDDGIDLMGFDLGGGESAPKPPVEDDLMGGDLLDLDPLGDQGIPAGNQNIEEDLMGGDLMDLSAPVNPKITQTPQPVDKGLDELDLMSLGTDSTPVSAPVQTNDNLLGEDLLGGLGSNPVSTTIGNTNLLGQVGSNTGPDLLGGDLLGSVQDSQPSASKLDSIVGHEDEILKLVLNLQKSDLNTTNISVNFINKTSSALTDVKLLVAVTKHLKMTLHPASGTVLQPNSDGGIIQSVDVVNNSQGKKKIAMRLKVKYSKDGQNFDKMTTVTNFPEGY